MLCLQSELEAELAEELASYGIDPSAQGLTDGQLAEAMAELERRRAGGWAGQRSAVASWDNLGQAVADQSCGSL